MMLDVNLGNLITIAAIVFSAGLSYAKITDKINEFENNEVGLRNYIETKLTDIYSELNEKFAGISERQKRQEERFLALLKHLSKDKGE